MADTNMRIVIDADSSGAVTGVKQVSTALSGLNSATKETAAGAVILGKSQDLAGVSASNVGRTFTKSGKIFKSTGKLLKSSGLDAASAGTAFLSTVPALSGMSSAAGGLVLGLESLSQVLGSLGPAGFAVVAGAALAGGAAYLVLRDHVGAAASAIRVMTAANNATANAHRAAAKAAWDQSGGELALKGAVLGEKEAVLRLRDAHSETARALKESGKGSADYKRALLDEKRAELDLTGAKRARVEAGRDLRKQQTDHVKALREELAAATEAAAATGKNTLAQRLGVIQGKDAEKAAAAHAEALKRLKMAQAALAAATINTAGTVKGLKGQMDALKSKALKIDVKTDQAVWNVAKLVGQMALVASKTVTLTVKTNHVRGSWNDQETIENLRKEPKKRSFEIDFRSMGTASVENSLKMTKAVITAINNARSRAATLSSNIAGSIGTGVDALLGVGLSALDQSPEAQRLRQIIMQQQAQQTATERANLNGAIQGATTPEELKAAQQALADWQLDQERQALEESLAQKTAALQREADGKKAFAERGIADLQDALNRQLITQKQYLSGIDKILSVTGMKAYGNLGDLLGSAFVSAFKAQLAGLKKVIVGVNGGRMTLVGAGPDMPSHSAGIDYVPRTGPALIHSGEAVLNRKDAAEYRAGGMGGNVQVTFADGMGWLAQFVRVEMNTMAEGARRRSLAAGAVR